MEPATSVAPVGSLWPVSGSAEEILGLLRDWDATPGEPEPLVVETSGSTGRPKCVVLSRRAMRASADATHERLGGPGHWMLALPPTYVAGLQVLFRSVRAGTDPVIYRGGELDEVPGNRTYVSLVPTQLYRLTQDGFDVKSLGRFDTVLVGGGPLHPQERTDAESMDIHVVQTYGMSETCGGCVYDGVPLDGVQVRVDEGRVLLGGPTLFDGYQDDPELTAQVLVDGWFRTDDLGSIDEGRLMIEGRADDVIITGGLKVPAVAVERMLLEHPSVRELAVVGVPDPEWGERVVAVVVLDGSPPDMDELRDLVTPRQWAPKQFLRTDALPRLTNGKVDRIALKATAGG